MKWHNFFTELRPFAAVNAVYFASVAGSYTEAMSVFSVGLLASLLLEVPTGVISDRIGRRATLVWGSVTFALSLFLYAIAGGLPLLLVGAVIGGLSDALVSGNNNALVFESLSQTGQKEKFSLVWGKLNSIFQVALGISALIGGLCLYVGVPLRDLVWMGFASQIICIICSFLITEPQRHESPSTNIYADLRDAVRLVHGNRKLRLNIIANSIQFGVGEAAHKFSPAFFGSVWPLWAVSALSSVRNVFGTLGYAVSGRVIGRLGDNASLFWSSGCMSALGIVASILNNAMSPALVFLNNFFYGINDVAKEHVLQQEFSDQQRATMGSLAQFCGSLVGVFAAMGLGVVADMTSPAVTFFCAMILRLPVIGLYWVLFQRKAAV